MTLGKPCNKATCWAAQTSEATDDVSAKQAIGKFLNIVCYAKANFDAGIQAMWGFGDESRRGKNSSSGLIASLIHRQSYMHLT